MQAAKPKFGRSEEYNPGMGTDLLERALKLTLEERIELVQEIWDSIESEMLRLPQPARARLARSLILSLGEGDDQEVEDLWVEEAERRYLEIERGDVAAIPSEDVFREARLRLK
jgi:putative addiction module component